MRRLSLVAVAVVVGMLVWAPGVAGAQGLGIGPRFSFVRGEAASGLPSTKFVGGTLRMRSSKHVALEVALDYRSELNEEATVRHRETPLQGSLLIFPVRGTFSPYLLGGVGMYSETDQLLNPTSGLVLSSTSARKTGWHLGLGAELFVARHAALFADYRFRFVHFGGAAEEDEAAGADPINIPGLSAIKLSHRGSMWTSGMAFYF
jgi:hypothetical protein